MNEGVLGGLQCTGNALVDFYSTSSSACRSRVWHIPLYRPVNGKRPSRGGEVYFASGKGQKSFRHAEEKRSKGPARGRKRDSSGKV